MDMIATKIPKKFKCLVPTYYMVGGFHKAIRKIVEIASVSATESLSLAVDLPILYIVSIIIL